MKKTTKVVIGAVVVLLVGAALVFSNTGLMKGSMQGLKIRSIGTTSNKTFPLASKVPTVKKVTPVQLPIRLTPGANNQVAGQSAATTPTEGQPAASATPTAQSPSTSEQPATTAEQQQPAPQPQPVEPGTLGVTLDGDTPISGVVMAGAVRVPFANYTFRTWDEPFVINKLSVVFDTNNNFTDSGEGDFPSIARVGISYGAYFTTAYADNIVNGVANFTNLGLKVPKDGTLKVRVIADIKKISDGAMSSQVLRLGLGRWFTFEATGELSGKVVNQPVETYMITDGIPLMTVRKTIPTVAKLANTPTKLVNGINDIASVTIKASTYGSIAIKKLKFESRTQGYFNMDEFKLYRKIGNGIEQDITDKVTVRPARDLLYVEWDKSPMDEEIISREITNTYIVRTKVSDAGIGSSFTTYMFERSYDLTNNFYDLVNFYDPTGVQVDHSFVWSDMSAVGHSTETADWTTGYFVPGLMAGTQKQTLTF